VEEQTIGYILQYRSLSFARRERRGERRKFRT